MIKKLAGAVLGLGVVVGLGAWLFAVPVAPSLSRPEIKTKIRSHTRGALEFEGASFGSLSMSALETHALPWRLAATSLVLNEVANNSSASISQETLNLILARYGFLVDTQPINRPKGAVVGGDNLPLGMNHAYLAPIGGTKLLVSNLGCAACHAGVTYDENGLPQPDKSWLGMPNTSLNLEAYVLAIFEAMRTRIKNPDELIEAAQKLFHDMEWRETMTLRWLVLPLVKDRMDMLKDVDRPLPFPNGVPGATNGVAALKYVLGINMIEGGKGDNGIVSIPELGGRVWKTSLLVDGAYVPLGQKRQALLRREQINEKHLNSLANITTFFTVPSMGVHPDQATTYRDEAQAIFSFLAHDYKPQQFPGVIDQKRARLGFEQYVNMCAQCHGSYEWADGKPQMSEFPNWLGEVGTDPLRAQAFTLNLAEAIKETTYSDTMHVDSTGLYIAPPLTGIWASAPYLHNGSVPTLDALLSPQNRPDSFMLGGHALDFNSLGINLNESGQYPIDYKPFSMPVRYDTKILGQGNGGHLFGEELEVDDKRNLVEFLKLL